ncbi:LysR family transcriptional regulator [Psychrobacter sp. I-STPA10]|uniref:LysR family transcriptional regulator n=1 Tax=Psychrobacter sp. I-STPA10 TaxID=2585769 RepID=UPI001E3F72AD|nr:LysR family transcriptional regulator [Psychrobacter sp. I-STPA10]
MDIDALRCFIAVVETGSYTRAAEQVHRSQSAVSQKMHKLEEQTDKRLFIKSGRELKLTEEGKFLLGYARHIISLHDDAMRQLQGSRQIMRPLQLGCPDDYAGGILPQVTQLIYQCVPNLPIHVHCHNSMQLRAMLDAGELDVAIVSRSSASKAGLFLQQDTGVWAYDGDTKRLCQYYQQNQSVPLVLYDESCHFHHAPIQSLSQHNIASQVLCSTGSLGAIQSLVLSGQGITVVASSSLGQMVALTTTDAPFILPKMPSVVIEMIAAANTHPNFGRSQLAWVCEQYGLKLA